MRRRLFAALAPVAALTIALTGAACGDGAVDTFPQGGNPLSTASSSGGFVDASSTGVGSSSGGGTGTDGGPVTSGEGGSAYGRTLFEALWPSLSMTCGGPCHQQGEGGAPLWLGPPDPYTSAVKYPGIIVSDPGASIIITKGRHEGPALADPLLTEVLTWLTAEAAALPPVVLPSSAEFTPANGKNDIDCSSAGIPGVHVTFDAKASGNLMTLSNLNVVTPAKQAIQFTYPIFAVFPTNGLEIDDASFSNLAQTVPEGTTAPLGPGLLVLTDWSSGAKMKIEFTTIAKTTVSDAGLSGGCKALPTFIADAVPAIQANTCLNCHNTGGSGNAALDLSGLASNPVDDAAACAQALGRADPSDPAQSQIILAPTGGLTNHPFTSAPQSFVTMMETWIAAEK